MAPLDESVAIIFGASTWPAYPDFDEQASFKKSAQFVREYLQENGLGGGRLLWMFDDPTDPLGLARSIGSFLRSRRVSHGFRNVLVYYVGHGRTDQRGYCLALSCTAEDHRTLSTLPIAELARLLNEHASDCRQFVILDACYAGDALADFVQNSVASSMRQAAHDDNRGTALLCAAAPKLPALAPAGESYTLFSGALREALLCGDPGLGDYLTFDQLGVLVARTITERADARGMVPPPVFPPTGDIRGVPLFPNPSAIRAPNAMQFRSLIGERDALLERLANLERDFGRVRNEVLVVGEELAWERDRQARGFYDLFDVTLQVDPFGDTAYTFRIRGISGPDGGEIKQIPYALSSTPDLGTCVIECITDEQTRWDVPKARLPEPAMSVKGQFELQPPASPARQHAGFTMRNRAINAFAMTTQDGQFRDQGETEYTGIGPRYPARHLRLSVMFPPRYVPAREPKIVARVKQAEQDEQPRQWPVDEKETERVRNGVFWDQDRGLAVLSVERASAGVHYELEWRLPPPPEALDPHAAIRAREQVRALFRLGQVDLRRLDEHLGNIRDAVCGAYFDLDPGAARSVDLALLLFDNKVMRVAGATFMPGTAARNLALRWGTGVAGTVMRRRAPHFVEVDKRELNGIYQEAVGSPSERFILCVPVPLPTYDTKASSLLRDPSMPCGIVSLSCSDENCNFERLKEPSGATVADVSSDLTTRVIALISEMAPIASRDRR